MLKPYDLLDGVLSEIENGLLFGPDIVHVPQFHVIGKIHKASFRDDLVITPKIANHFYENERTNIPNMINPNIHINICREAGADADYSLFMPAVHVNTTENIPEGFDCYTFPSSLCANFRFVSPPNSVVNMAAADAMFNAIDGFMDDDYQKYFLERKRINFERFDSSAYDSFFHQWEWFAPVVKKTKYHVPASPDGIIKIYKQEVPALRFIGKKFIEPLDDSVFKKILANLDNLRLEYFFDAIEKKSNKDLKTLYEGGDTYVSLVRKENDAVEYWLGMFMPKGIEAPDGCGIIDFPKSALGVCSVYGKRNGIIQYDTACRKKLTEEGFLRLKDEDASGWFFQRFNWHTFYAEDKFGKRLLEYCYFL